jgi:hypothetical protein
MRLRYSNCHWWNGRTGVAEHLGRQLLTGLDRFGAFRGLNLPKVGQSEAWAIPGGSDLLSDCLGSVWGSKNERGALRPASRGASMVEAVRGSQPGSDMMLLFAFRLAHCH